jgi:hypothetical protein
VGLGRASSQWSASNAVIDSAKLAKAAENEVASFPLFGKVDDFEASDPNREFSNSACPSRLKNPDQFRIIPVLLEGVIPAPPPLW